jgi:hypothetical protein
MNRQPPHVHAKSKEEEHTELPTPQRPPHLPTSAPSRTHASRAQLAMKMHNLRGQRYHQQNCPPPPTASRSGRKREDGVEEVHKQRELQLALAKTFKMREPCQPSPASTAESAQQHRAKRTWKGRREEPAGVEENEELQRDEKRGRNKKRATRSCRTEYQSCQSHSTAPEGAYTRHCSAARNGVDVAMNPPRTSTKGGRTRCARPPARRRMGVEEHVAASTIPQPKVLSAVEPEHDVRQGAAQR